MTDQTPTVLDTARPRKKLNLAPIVQEIKAKTGSSVGFFSEWGKLMFGPGKVLFDEYLDMRLWDPAMYPRAGLKEFTGNSGMRKFWQAANFIAGSQALAANKIASYGFMSAYGLPVPTLLGLHAAAAVPGKGRTSTPEALETFLLKELTYPAFGKPMAGFQSLGSVSLASCDAASGMLTRLDGQKVSAKALAQEIHTAYAKTGYLFQQRLVPHDAVRALCGERTATVRVMTIMTPEGPRVFRACWKIPSGANWVDNFWRSGNLLATINMADGSVIRTVSGTGLAMTEVEKHPDTQSKIPGMKVPLWEEICKTALAGASVMSDFGLLGWDIAATSSGAVIVEVNETPDAVMHQIADRKGLMDETFRTFINDRRRAAQAWKNELQTATRKEFSPTARFATTGK